MLKAVLEADDRGGENKILVNLHRIKYMNWTRSHSKLIKPESDFTRRATAHTCGCVLKLPANYHSLREFRPEIFWRLSTQTSGALTSSRVVRTPPGNLEYSWIFICNFSGPGKPGEMMLFFEI